ncbi:AAA family ATPase [Pseudoxanthomonas daejeonensis]|uniref:ATPase n=1 Tax=Pseudoxanthomonas daejeonensis TaxID=266062 RepID=A0ABQ6Z759_9GAMM|nr:AAA family ATPase [Pseudoxanthomonas daejeonensis]KAF1694717.1 ATPase [Pseudoxanthomonas daejeonensis]
MSAFAHGLVVGKFCPLHIGHQLLLNYAQESCEELTVLSYTKPGFPGMDAPRREEWLSALYPRATHWVLDDDRLAAHCRQRGVAVQTLPQNDNGDDVHRQFVAWLLREVIGRPVDVIFTSEAYGPGFAQALSRCQLAIGEPEVSHVSVDMGRRQLPISGTAIRGDLHAHRQWLSPLVYKDFVRRVAIVGGESTGKSTLAVALAQAFGTVHAPEYGRELWEAQGGILAESDLLHIARTQVAREDSLSLTASRFLMCDTTPLTTLLYARAMFGRSDPALDYLAQRGYDRWILCDPDVPFVQDGTRRNDAFRHEQHKQYLEELAARGTRYLRLSGAWDTRIITAIAAVEELDSEPYRDWLSRPYPC